jgi:hypothetical protein
MEHPLIGSLDELTEDQLSEKINDLYRKLGIATQSGNGHLCNQLRMAIESYQTKYQDKLRASRENTTAFSDKINIQ